MDSDIIQILLENYFLNIDMKYKLNMDVTEDIANAERFIYSGVLSEQKVLSSQYGIFHYKLT